MQKNETYVQAVSLVGLPALAEEGGIDLRELMTEVGIPPAALDRPQMLISHRAHAHLIELLALRLDRPALGLEWSESLVPNFAKVAPIAILAYFSRNVREWLELTQRFFIYHTNGTTLQLHKYENDLAALRYVGDSFALPSRQLVEHVLALICLMARHVTGHVDEYPTLVRMRHSRPTDTSAHARVFNCPVEFNALHDEVVFEKRYLGFATNGNFRLFRPLVEQFLRFQIDRTPAYNQTMTTTVSLAISGVLGAGKCDADFIANILSMNTKKMQRLLAAEGTTFSELLDQVRENTARSLLIESHAPISQIAGLLDYASTSPFIAAFRRWTRKSPLAFRKDFQRRRRAQRHSGKTDTADRPI